MIDRKELQGGTGNSIAKSISIAILRCEATYRKSMATWNHLVYENKKRDVEFEEDEGYYDVSRKPDSEKIIVHAFLVRFTMHS